MRLPAALLHPFEDASETHAELARIARFDFVANNTGRTSGHVRRRDDGRIWGIDQGLCFSAAFKLRTVICDFPSEPIPEPLLADIAPLAEAVAAELAELLDDEITDLRATALTVALSHSGIKPDR